MPILAGGLVRKSDLILQLFSFAMLPVPVSVACRADFGNRCHDHLSKMLVARVIRGISMLDNNAAHLPQFVQQCRRPSAVAIDTVLSGKRFVSSA
jgi:hypothetical protein